MVARFHLAAVATKRQNDIMSRLSSPRKRKNKKLSKNGKQLTAWKKSKASRKPRMLKRSNTCEAATAKKPMLKRSKTVEGLRAKKAPKMASVSSKLNLTPAAHWKTIRDRVRTKGF